jgi:hypothetical protein
MDTAGRWWPSRFGVGRGLTTPTINNIVLVMKYLKEPQLWTDFLV